MNLNDELFEESGLEKVLGNNANMDVKDLVESIFNSVNEFAGEAEQAYDITTAAFIFKDRLRNQREIL